jgi:hypothetical protein
MGKKFTVVGMEDSYSDNFSKLALAATSAQLAKVVCVKEFGVGEDLTFNFMGWNGDELIIVCQLRKDMMLIAQDERLAVCKAMCNSLRRYWGITAVTMVAEGYCSLDPSKTINMELAKAYVDPDSGVQECITLTHAEINHEINDVEVNLIALPYTYDVGRDVIWLEMLIYPTRAQEVLRNSKYPQMLKESLKKKISDEIGPDDYDELRSSIASNGFYIQEFY